MVRRAPLARGKEWDAKLLVFLRLARAARVLPTVSSRQKLAAARVRDEIIQTLNGGLDKHLRCFIVVREV